MEGKPISTLLLLEEIFRHPFVDPALDCVLMHDLRLVILQRPLPDQCQGFRVHLFHWFRVLEGTAAPKGRPLLAESDFLVKAPVLHPQTFILQILFHDFRPCRALSMLLIIRRGSHAVLLRCFTCRTPHRVFYVFKRVVILVLCLSNVCGDLTVSVLDRLERCGTFRNICTGWLCHTWLLFETERCLGNSFLLMQLLPLIASCRPAIVCIRSAIVKRAESASFLERLATFLQLLVQVFAH